MASGLDVDLEFVLQVARKAGDQIRKNFSLGRQIIVKHGSGEKITNKSAADLVTEVDVAVEKMVTDHLLGKYPTHIILGEETAPTDDQCPPDYDQKTGAATFPKILTEKPTWIIDPIDGTTNFVHGVPFVAVSIGYYKDFIPQLGVVYNPILDEMFYATRGQGAFLQRRQVDYFQNSQNPIPVQQSNDSSTNTQQFTSIRLTRDTPECRSIRLGQSLVGCGFLIGEVSKLRDESKLSAEKLRWTKNLKKAVIGNVSNVLPNCRDVRRCGSAAVDMCMVAAGRLDAWFELGPHEWDIAAGLIICKEAGCLVSDFDGVSPIPKEIHTRRTMVCCNEEVAKEMGALLGWEGV